MIYITHSLPCVILIPSTNYFFVHMDPLPEGKIVIHTSPNLVEENNYLTENQSRVENHKKILAHLEAITRLLDATPIKTEPNTTLPAESA